MANHTSDGRSATDIHHIQTAYPFRSIFMSVADLPSGGFLDPLSCPPAFPVMTWILYHLVFGPCCNGDALCVRRGSFSIWSNPKTLKP